MASPRVTDASPKDLRRRKRCWKIRMLWLQHGGAFVKHSRESESAAIASEPRGFQAPSGVYACLAVGYLPMLARKPAAPLNGGRLFSTFG
jgi:hypothetical protein